MPENESVDINKKILLAKEVSESELDELVKNIKTAIKSLPEIAVSSDKDMLLNAITDSDDEEIMNKKDRKRLRRKIRSADEEVYMTLISNGFHSKDNKEEINSIWSKLFVDSYFLAIEQLKGEGVILGDVPAAEVQAQMSEEPSAIEEPVMAISEESETVQEAIQEPQEKSTPEISENKIIAEAQETEEIAEEISVAEHTQESQIVETQVVEAPVDEAQVVDNTSEAVSEEEITITQEVQAEAQTTQTPVPEIQTVETQPVSTSITEDSDQQTVDARKLSLDEQIEAQLNQTIEQTIDAQLDSYLGEEKSAVYIESNNDSGSYESYNDDLLKNKGITDEENVGNEQNQENDLVEDSDVSQEVEEEIVEVPTDENVVVAEEAIAEEITEEVAAEAEPEEENAEAEPEAKGVTKEDIDKAMSSHKESHTFLLAMAPPPPPPPPKTFWDPDDSEYDDAPKRALEALNNITQGEKWNQPTKEGSAHEFYTIFGYKFKNIDNVIPALNNKIAELCGIENAFMVRTLIKSSAVMLGRNTKILIIHRHIAENAAVIDAIEHLSDIMEEANVTSDEKPSVDNDNNSDDVESNVA